MKEMDIKKDKDFLEELTNIYFDRLLGYLSYNVRTNKKSERRDLNPRHPPWQGGALPLSYFRIAVVLREEGLEPSRGGTSS